jgi:hypothetical protein
MDLFIKSNFVNDQRTANIWSKKLAVQCLNDPDSYRDCASYQDHWWQESFTIGSASRCVSEITDVDNFCFTLF